MLDMSMFATLTRRTGAINHAPTSLMQLTEDEIVDARQGISDILKCLIR
jgi:hypothetical protein